MSINHEQLFPILYHPLAYTHRSHLPPVWQPVETGSEPLLNYWLSTYYQLSDLPAQWRTDHTLTPLVLQHWYQLPAIAHLIGGYLLRALLPHQGLTLLMDPPLLAFIALPLVHRARFTGNRPPSLDTRACGVAFILSQCQCLPHGLHQRLLLQFPATIDLPTLDAPPIPDHINLFKMAINYANCFPSRTA